MIWYKYILAVILSIKVGLKLVQKSFCTVRIVTTTQTAPFVDRELYKSKFGSRIETDSIWI